MSRFVDLAFLAVLSSCGGSDGPSNLPQADAAAAAPATSFTWTIKKSGLTATCASAGADEVRMTATSEGGIPTDHTFQCVLVPSSLSLPPGRYAITAQLYDGTGPQMLASSSAQAVTVPASGTPATVTFAFSF